MSGDKTPPLTQEEARGLARRWAAERAIASFEVKATDEQVALVCNHGTLSEHERERLFAWVRERMSMKAERRRGARVSVCRYRGFEGVDPPSGPVWDGLPDKAMKVITKFRARAVRKGGS